MVSHLITSLPAFVMYQCIQCQIYIYTCMYYCITYFKRCQLYFEMSQQTKSVIFHTKMLQMHFGVRLHGQNACYVIFWNIAPKHWIYMDTGYCNSFYFCLWLYIYWEYVIECVFAVEGHIILKIWLILRI